MRPLLPVILTLSLGIGLALPVAAVNWTSETTIQLTPEEAKECSEGCYVIPKKVLMAALANACALDKSKGTRRSDLRTDTAL